MGLKIVLLVLAVCTYCCYSTSCSKDGNVCATLYEGEDYSGSSFRLSDGASHSDFSQKCALTDTAWDSTFSLSVEDGCSLTLCSEESFRGTCLNFTKGTQSPYLPLGLISVRSGSCSCAVVRSPTNFLLRLMHQT